MECQEEKKNNFILCNKTLTAKSQRFVYFREFKFKAKENKVYSMTHG